MEKADALLKQAEHYLMAAKCIDSVEDPGEEARPEGEKEWTWKPKS